MPGQQSLARVLPPPQLGESAPVVVLKVRIRLGACSNILDDLLPARLLEEFSNPAFEV